MQFAKLCFPLEPEAHFCKMAANKNKNIYLQTKMQNFYCIFEPLKILIFAYDLCNFSILDPLRKSEIVCCISFFWCRRALHPFSWILYGSTWPLFQFLLLFHKFCFPLERQAQFWKSLVCKCSKFTSIWHPKLSENLPLWSLLPPTRHSNLASEFSRHSSHSHFFQTSGIGRPLGYEFRMSAAVPFVHVSFNTLISINFFIFFVFFTKMCLPLGCGAWSRRVLVCKRLKTTYFGF